MRAREPLCQQARDPYPLLVAAGTGHAGRHVIGRWAPEEGSVLTGPQCGGIDGDRVSGAAGALVHDMPIPNSASPCACAASVDADNEVSGTAFGDRCAAHPAACWLRPALSCSIWTSFR